MTLILGARDEAFELGDARIEPSAHQERPGGAEVEDAEAGAREDVHAGVQSGAGVLVGGEAREIRGGDEAIAPGDVALHSEQADLVEGERERLIHAGDDR